MPEPQRVAIIGGGYAGMAAAVTLAEAGVAVDVYEATRSESSLGGRARRADLGADWINCDLDNGQHILVGAYRATLRLMALVGANPDQLLLRQPLLLDLPGQLRLAAPRWPAPLHLAAALLTARGLSWSEKLAAARFMLWLKTRRYRLAQDIPVKQLLRQHQQSAKLCQLLWQPLCIATLNTPANTASAQIFANVLRDTLGAHRAASDLLLPRVNLSALFPVPAAEFVRQRGGQVHCGQRIDQLERSEDGWQVAGQRYQQVILATAPQHVSKLLPGNPALHELRTTLNNFHYEPILTAYLQYPPEVRLPLPMLGNGYGLGQWVFDRGQLGGANQAGLLAVVVSASQAQKDADHARLCQQLHEEIRALLATRNITLPDFIRSQIIVEQRATFACTVALKRPDNTSGLPGLLLAGDYTASDYPATLESAVSSGIAAAKLILQCSNSGSKNRLPGLPLDLLT